MNSLLQAAPVPWPPDRVIDPAIRPINGSNPSIFAMPMPMAFCTNSSPSTTNRNTISALPPARNRARLAFSPIVAKKASISGSFSDMSKLISQLANFFRANNRRATSKPPATGAGMVYFRSRGMLLTHLPPRSKTSVAATNVP